MLPSIRLIAVILALALFYTGCQEESVRIAHFNIREFSLEKINDVDENGAGHNPQLLAAAAIIEEVNPDILLLQEIDHDYTNVPEGEADLSGPVRHFMKNYLHSGENPSRYEYIFAAPCNTGLLTGIDLDGDGTTAQKSDLGTSTYAADSYGWGTYPGQYSMVLLSRFPFDSSDVRTFQKFLWKDLPGNHLPRDYYSQAATEILRLSSKSHWDITVMIGSDRLHMLVSHPTPPVFDGPEDRNGRRNFDEIMFWKLYLNGNQLLYDDKNRYGGYEGTDPYIIAGDLNADQGADIAYEGINAISQLLSDSAIQDTRNFLTSTGSAEGREENQKYFTAQFGNNNRMKIDYLLVSKNIRIVDGAVFWPSSQKDPARHRFAETASDHRLIWLDVILPDKN
jgi:endonuclease/exonuclease/phosphatase family metal-dependent hydrolase